MGVYIPVPRNAPPGSNAHKPARAGHRNYDQIPRRAWNPAALQPGSHHHRTRPRLRHPLSNDTVSARHAHLIYHHNQWWIEDLASTNGTKLNDTPVSIPTVITSGDELQCGGISLSVSLSENVVIEPTQRLEKRNTSPLQ
ncbi:MAG: FHA domain-containing protein [Anaerolineales bacterium]|nr:FHA domain-containing protein [Anaerolineales bacterium]